MTNLVRRKTPSPVSDNLVKRKTISDSLEGNTAKKKTGKPKVSTKMVVSTGCTILDLAISGGVHRGGGIPGSIMVEIYGPSSSGKTTLLVEIGASIQSKGGTVDLADPEA